MEEHGICIFRVDSYPVDVERIFLCTSDISLQGNTVSQPTKPQPDSLSREK